MSRQKKTRRITDIMPARKSDNKTETPRPHTGKKLTRYELDARAREEKRKKKRKGLASGSRHSAAVNADKRQNPVAQDPRIGSRKKVPLVVEFVNNPERGQVIPASKTAQKSTALDPALELEQLENNECLNRLLDELETGKKLNAEDQRFVDQCLVRIEQLMRELGIEEEENGEDLYRTFENIDINRFR